MRSRTPRATPTSLSPRAFVTSKPTTGRPSSSAAERRSPIVSLTFASWSRRTRRPPAREISIAASSSAERTVASVRTACSPPPRSMRPPDSSRCNWRSPRDTSAAVASRAVSRAGSSSTRTSRATPPTLATPPTPRTASRAFEASFSTNQDSASSSMRDDATV